MNRQRHALGDPRFSENEMVGIDHADSIYASDGCEWYCMGIVQWL